MRPEEHSFGAARRRRAEKGDGLKRLELEHGPTPLRAASTCRFSRKKDDPSMMDPHSRVNRGDEEAASSPPPARPRKAANRFRRNPVKAKEKNPFGIATLPRLSRFV